MVTRTQLTSQHSECFIIISLLYGTKNGNTNDLSIPTTLKIIAILYSKKKTIDTFDLAIPTTLNISALWYRKMVIKMQSHVLYPDTACNLGSLWIQPRGGW